MKRSIGRRLTLMLFCITVLSLSGCLSTGRVIYPFENGQKVKKAELPSPETHTLIFGNMACDGLLREGTIDSMEFAQINPQLEPKFVYPGVNHSMFYLQPVEPGSIMQLVSWLIQSGRSGVYSLPGIQQHKYTLTFEAKKPGLLYVGSYFLGRAPGNTKILGRQELFFQKRDTPDELTALQYLEPLLKDTSWQPVIEQRIKELTNE